MIFVKTTQDKPDFNSLEKIGKILKEGGIVIYPTDTVYGIGCDVFNEKSVERIYELKRREKSKPFPILLSSIDVAYKIAKLSEYEEKIAKTFWPGALTIVVNPRIKFFRYFLNEEGKIAIRVPNNRIPRILAEFINGMIVGTSANISGMKPATTAEEALDYIKDVDAVIDAGACDFKKSSTVIEVFGKEIKLLREGPIPISKIKEVIKE
jgi:L-threonylcarbamoyladenylate synthase